MHFTVSIIHSQQQPDQAAVSGLSLQRIFSTAAAAEICSKSMSEKALFAPTKFLPLSEYIVVGLPVLSKKRLKDSWKSSVDNNGTNSKCGPIHRKSVQYKTYFFLHSVNIRGQLDLLQLFECLREATTVREPGR